MRGGHGSGVGGHSPSFGSSGRGPGITSKQFYHAQTIARHKDTTQPLFPPYFKPGLEIGLEYEIVAKRKGHLDGLNLLILYGLLLATQMPGLWWRTPSGRPPLPPYPLPPVRSPPAPLPAAIWPGSIEANPLFHPGTGCPR